LRRQTNDKDIREQSANAQHSDLGKTFPKNSFFCHYWWQSKIFASGVNFSIKQHILWHNRKQLKLALPSPISTSTSWVLVLYSGKYSVKNKAAQQEAEIK